MQRTFKAKADSFYIAITVVLLVMMIFLFWFHYIFFAGILLVVNVIITQKLLHTNYAFSDKMDLVIQSGFFPFRYLSLKNIKEMKPAYSRNMRYAINTDGIWIILISGKRYFISPEDIDGFMSWYKKQR